MSYTSSIVIGVLVVVVIGLIVTLTVVLSVYPENESTVPINQPEPETEGSDIEIKVDTSIEKTQSTTERGSCAIKFPETDDGQPAQTVAIGEPWYLSPNNPKQCFAPVGQKCCEQIDLPSGEEGCMIDFTGYTPATIDGWKKECLMTGNILDMDKLGVLSAHFSGQWQTESEDDAHLFDLEVPGVNLKIKKDGLMLGLYKVKQITVNPNKQINASYTSDTGTKTDVIVEDVMSENGNGTTNGSTNATTNILLKITQSAPNGAQDLITSYRLRKLQ